MLRWVSVEDAVPSEEAAQKSQACPMVVRAVVG